ncbi:MAG TPA: ribosome maturation factor RimM [Bacteroidota bacterium]
MVSGIEESQEEELVKKELFAIGRIRKCVGVKGEVAVETLTPSAERFSRLKTVLVGREGTGDSPEAFSVERVRSRGGDVVVKLRAVDDRTRAEKLIGDNLYVTESDRIEPPPHAYFIHDIIGLTVEDENGTPIGTVVDVLRMPAQDIYVVRRNSDEFWIPSVREIVRDVDLRRRVLQIRVFDGLLEPH